MLGKSRGLGMSGFVLRRLGLAGAGVMSVAGLLLAGFAGDARAESGVVASEPGAASRLVEVDDGAVVRLDMPVRVMRPAEEQAGPVVVLVGAVHIADGEFYRDAQAVLDAADVVLFEGVGGGPVAEAVENEANGEAAAADARAETRRRIDFVTALLDAREADGEEVPASLDGLMTVLGPTLAARLDAARLDGWGNPLRLVKDDGGAWQVVSNGADGEPGGGGELADMSGTDARAGVGAADEAGGNRGLQADLASALGLSYQLDGIDYSGANWRNSDLSVGELAALFGAEAVPAEEAERVRAADRDAELTEDEVAAEAMNGLIGAISGESRIARLAGGFLRFAGRTPGFRAIIKLMLIETLGQAEDVLGAQQGAMGRLFEVILDERNEVVLADIDALADREPGVEVVSVFYGAGHMPGIEVGLFDRGYELEQELWLPAITVDLRAAGVDPAQAKAMRRLIASTIEMQTQMLEGRGDEE
ncbi:MAG: hypothetical protein AAF968_27335 [Pseudomonadota bacterium]